MNEDTESFEQRFKRQPLRRVPPEWRGEILKAASEARGAHKSTAVVEYSFLLDLNRRLASLLWPHPVAWAGLAAVWIFIFAVDFSIRDAQPVVAEKIARPSPEEIAELRQQQRLFVELTGGNDSSDADRQKTFVPRPRSERMKLFSA